MFDEISAKNTKNEILEAYQSALEQLKQAKTTTRQDIKNQNEKQETVKKATSNATDDIVKNIASLKLSLNRSLEEVEEQWVSSHKQLATLQQAIDIQTNALSELHDITVNIDTLSALLNAQKEKTTRFDNELKIRSDAFEQDIQQKRVQWRKEQEEFELARKEHETLTKKTREREEEEYLYQRDLARQKERDLYLAEKESLDKELTTRRAALEQEFSAREAIIKSQEQEYKLLKQKAEQFPAELQKAIEDTTNAITERLTFKFDYETKLAQKEVEGERKLYQQMVTALEAKVAQLETQTKQLTEKSTQATMQVQDIAVKAIESAANPRFMPMYGEKLMEQVKQ